MNAFMCPDWPVCDPLEDNDVPVWRDPQHYTPKALQDHREDIWAALLETGAFATDG